MAGATRPKIDCGDLDMRIAADGTWYYRGSRIGRMKLVKLFASVLCREDNGGYWLVTPVERGRVTVDDAPFVIVEAEIAGEGPSRQIRLRSNIDQWVELGDAHPLQVAAAPDGRLHLYVGLERGLTATLARPVWYQLLDLALADSDTDGDAGQGDGPAGAIGLWAGGMRFDLSELAKEEA